MARFISVMILPVAPAETGGVEVGFGAKAQQACVIVPSAAMLLPPAAQAAQAVVSVFKVALAATGEAVVPS